MKRTLHTIRRWSVYGITLSTLSLSLLSGHPTQAQSGLSRIGRSLFASTIALASSPSAAVRNDDQEELGATIVKKSALASVKLPEGTLRISGKKHTAAFQEVLTKLAEKNKVRLGATETLAWQNAEEIQKQVIEAWEEAGYRYEAQTVLETDEGKLTPFTCEPASKKGKKPSLFGFWGENGSTLVMMWAAVRPEVRTEADDAGTIETPSDKKESAPDKPAAKALQRPAQRVTGGKAPADLLGDWSWTTIGGINYINITTHQLAEPSGMSARFTFTRDGRYKKFFYIRQRTYSLVTESTTTEEGKVTFGENSFTMSPEKGYYKGHTGTRIIDRPMTAAERKPTTFRWEWRTENGARRLYLGPTADSLKQFKSAN